MDSRYSPEADTLLKGAAKLGIGGYGRVASGLSRRELDCYGDVVSAIRRADEELEHDPDDRVELYDRTVREIKNMHPGIFRHFKRQRAGRFLSSAQTAGRALDEVERSRASR